MLSEHFEDKKCFLKWLSVMISKESTELLCQAGKGQFSKNELYVDNTTVKFLVESEREPIQLHWYCDYSSAGFHGQVLNSRFWAFG